MTDLVDRVDRELRAFLDERTSSLESIDGAATEPAREIRRILEAGGKRLRPVFCYWGYRAGGGADDTRIVRAAAALELLHTMAIVHDDLIDGSKERRGVPSTSAWYAGRAIELGAAGDPEEFGRSMALLVGDLAAVWADLLFLTSGFAAETLVRAQAEYHVIRDRMAAGQYLDLVGTRRDPEVARLAAWLKGGSYTVEGPLLIGATLGDAAESVREGLRRFGRPLGEAFQLRDDLEDGDAAAGVTPALVNELVDTARGALDRELLGPEPTEALVHLADRVAM